MEFRFHIENAGAPITTEIILLLHEQIITAERLMQSLHPRLSLNPTEQEVQTCVIMPCGAALNKFGSVLRLVLPCFCASLWDSELMRTLC